MKRLPMTVYAGLLVAAMAAPSFAADLPRPSYKAPIYTAPGFSWTGFYVGINGGYGFGKSEWSALGASSGEFDVKGAMLGGTLGYNLQTGSWVWGLEGDIDYTWINGTTTTPFCGPGGCETTVPWFATARGRIGYAGWDRWLPYITGGAAFAQIKMTPPGGPDEKETKVGWTVGGGIEYALWNNWSSKIEYLYADLGTATCTAATCGVATDVTFKSHIVRLGLNYRF